MKPSSETYADLFSMNFRAIRALTRDVTEDEARRRPDGRQNPVSWMVGHIATYRVEALSRLGIAVASGSGLRDLFGQDVRSDPHDWPALPELVATLSQLNDSLLSRLRTLGDAAFEPMITTPAGAQVPAILFLHFHESYHVGQLGYLRTWLGKAPLVKPGPPKAAG
jgi:hypothetical protein